MRQVSETFAARLAADETTLCVCWRFTRRDGGVFGATDHDEALTFDGLRYTPAAGLEAATFESSAGLAPGRAMANGALSLDFMSGADVDAGLWDGARVDVWRVDWREPEHRIAIWSGRLSEVSRKGEAFAAELVSLKAGFEKSIGRVYARNCDADVGDVRCRVDLGDPAFRAESLIAEVISVKRFSASGIDAFGEGWFTGGVVTWTGGPNAGAAARVARQAGGEIELAAAPRLASEAGDTFVVTAGCDKIFATCGGKFANLLNFRGFPHVPGVDAVLAGPASDHANDGGRRG
jgi:uncharacterized phage protein (TIGR02218 family)